MNAVENHVRTLVEANVAPGSGNQLPLSLLHSLGANGLMAVGALALSLLVFVVWKQGLSCSEPISENRAT